jgi:hypothetical protein
MSLNLIVAVQQEDHNKEVRPMILPRFKAGLTSTATVSRDDTIDFNGLSCRIIGMIHHYVNGDIAPVTDVHGEFHQPLSDFEINVLVEQFGFKDMNNG